MTAAIIISIVGAWLAMGAFWLGIVIGGNRKATPKTPHLRLVPPPSVECELSYFTEMGPCEECKTAGKCLGVEELDANQK